MNLERERPRRKAVMLDPHPLCHAALGAVLAPFDIELVGATTSPCDALALLEKHRPDLFVAEIDLPAGTEDALEVIETARRDDPRLTVIVLSATDDRTLVDAAFDRGASAYVLKTSDPDAITTAIRQAFEPSLYLARPRETTGNGQLDSTLLRKLTRRELEILQLVSGGLSNRQVAGILWVTDQTVKFHLANVYRKLGVRSRFEAARWARENGLLDSMSTPNVVALPTNGSRRTPRAALVPIRKPSGAAREAGETSR